ncbi:MAG: TetR/AcrR family transcriptional regulator [Desulfobulbus sp.]|nr:MAG: TetR/AcrR family transcriptional regulator [Desulfobulbus sp.]
MQEPRKGEQTKQVILQKTRMLLVTKGFHHTSVSEIIAASGVQKGSLYYHFPSKEELGLAVLEDARDEFFAILEQSLTGTTPLAKVFNSLEAVRRQMQKANFVGGCLFGNSALEMSDSNPRFQEVIREVFARWVDLLTKTLAEHRESDGTTLQEPRLLAKLIVAAIEGGIMMARVSKDGRDLDDCIRSLRRLLERQPAGL